MRLVRRCTDVLRETEIGLRLLADSAKDERLFHIRRIIAELECCTNAIRADLEKNEDLLQSAKYFKDGRIDADTLLKRTKFDDESMAEKAKHALAIFSSGTCADE